MDSERQRFLVTATLLAFILLNSLGIEPVRWFQQISFALASGVLLYVMFGIVSPLVKWIRSE